MSEATKAVALAQAVILHGSAEASIILGTAAAFDSFLTTESATAVGSVCGQKHEHCHPGAVGLEPERVQGRHDAREYFCGLRVAPAAAAAPAPAPKPVKAVKPAPVAKPAVPVAAAPAAVPAGDELRNKVVAAIRSLAKRNRAECESILGEFGAKSLGSLKPEDYEAALEKFEAALISA